MLFRAAFPFEAFIFNPQIPVVNIINCKREGPTKAFAFAPSMHSESSLAGNIAVFEDLNVDQLGFDKNNPR